MAVRSCNKAERVVGFDCEFVVPPPEVLQSECPVCLLIIRDPHQVTCCGKKFCEPCIQRIKTDKKPCPTCKTEAFSDFPDQGLKQSLYTLKVRCTHQNNGCMWTGQLGHIDGHLNTDPEPERRLEGCPLTTINCDFLHVGCAVKISRKDMPEHLRENLLTHISLLATSHSKLDTIYTKLVDRHALLESTYATLAGQHAVLKDKYSRLRNSHEKLAAGHSKLVGEHTALDKAQTRLANEHATLSTSHVELLCKYENLKEDCDKLKHENERLKVRVSTLELGPGRIANPQNKELIKISQSDVLIMTNFEEYKRYENTWYSPPVYTHHQGYKICLRVYANGDGVGKGTHISVFVYFVRGEFDDFLTWPFCGTVSFQLLDQRPRGSIHKPHDVILDNTVGLECRQRAVHTERAKSGWGCAKLIPHVQLKPNYLQNNCLQFIITGGEAHV